MEMLLTDQEREFLAAFAWEASTDPFKGPATDDLHSHGIYHSDLLHLLWAYEQEKRLLRQGWEDHQNPNPPPCPWKTKEEALKRNADIGISALSRMDTSLPDTRAEVVRLLERIQENLTPLESLLAETDREDEVYRFYHQSFKVYRIQMYTEKIVTSLQALAAHLPMNAWFLEIVRQGTGREWEPKDNDNWTAITRPMVEAFFHARFFLAMVCKYGKELETPPGMLPSGWAAVLYLYNLR